MSEYRPAVGSIGWHDLTIPNATEVADFYADVVGLQVSPVSMGDYDDFNLMNGEVPTAGVCHARGENAGIPPQWLLYFVVEDLAASLDRCVARGGKVVHGPRGMGEGGLAIIQDPSGAVCGLWQNG